MLVRNEKHPLLYKKKARHRHCYYFVQSTRFELLLIIASGSPVMSVGSSRLVFGHVGQLMLMVIVLLSTTSLRDREASIEVGIGIMKTWGNQRCSDNSLKLFWTSVSEKNLQTPCSIRRNMILLNSLYAN